MRKTYPDQRTRDQDVKLNKPRSKFDNVEQTGNTLNQEIKENITISKVDPDQKYIFRPKIDEHLKKSNCLSRH